MSHGMLKKAFVLGLLAIVVLPFHLFDHPPHFDWMNASVGLLAAMCLGIGLSRRR